MGESGAASSDRKDSGLEDRGQYFENCSCDVPCPCTVSLDLGADRDRCNAFLVFEVESGEVDGVDVSGVTVAAMIDTKVMSEGNWRLGVLIDDQASDAQADKLAAVFGGQLGGRWRHWGRWSVSSSDWSACRWRSRTWEPPDQGRRRRRGGSPGGRFGRQEDGKPARLVSIFHPAGEDLTIARATKSHLSAFGIDFSFEGGSGFANPFSWAA